jgi:hypothetical protein
MMLLAQGMTGWDFLHANWGWFATAGVSIGTAMLAGLAAFGRGVYIVYQDWVKKHNDRQDDKAQKEGKALETVSETLPRLATNGEMLTNLLTESRKIDSDIIKTQVGMHGAIVDLADCMVLNACPEMRDRFEKDVARVKNRIKAVAPKFREPPE